jgi:hypothetical protein
MCKGKTVWKKHIFTVILLCLPIQRIMSHLLSYLKLTNVFKIKTELFEISGSHSGKHEV